MDANEIAKYASIKQSEFLTAKKNLYFRNKFVNNILMSIPTSTFNQIINDAFKSCNGTLDIYELLSSLEFIEELCEKDKSIAFNPQTIHNYSEEICKKLDDERQKINKNRI